VLGADTNGRGEDEWRRLINVRIYGWWTSYTYTK
jgi:hypothetical protein